MSRSVAIVSAVFCLALAAPVTAQVCGGRASFASNPYQVAGGAEFGDNAKAFGGQFAFGGRGAFGEIGLSTTSYDNVDGSTMTFSGGAGYEMSLDKKGVFYLCPVAGIAFGSGPHDIDYYGDGSLVLDLSETDFNFGISVGAVASQTSTTRIIPTASIALVNASGKAKDQVSGTSASQSETYGSLGLGMGFLFNEVVSVRPGVAIPFGLDGASTSFSATVSINFGKK